MSATEPRPTASHTAISLKRLHHPKYWRDVQDEYLPRRAEFEVQVGPSLDFTRVWRELVIDLESGPGYLYRYLPFSAIVYVDGRAQTIIEFGAPFERQQASIRVAVGSPARITLVTELGHVPANSGEGSDNRELALRFHGISLGEGLARAPLFAQQAPREHYELDTRSSVETAAQPIFVIGPYRSGTSVLTWALGQHPNIWPMEETGWIPPLADAAILGYRNATTAPRNFFEVYDLDRRQYLTQIGTAIDTLCRSASSRYQHVILLGRLSGRDHGFNESYQLARSIMNPKRRWVDGTPENTNYITSLLAIFPSVRFIGLVRNPLDVVSSMLRFDRAGGETRTVAAAAQMWIGNAKALLLAYRAFGPRIVRLVPYEDLTNEVERTLRDLFDFLDEPHFFKSAETFAKRINSSQISPEERASLYAEIDTEPDLKEHMLTLHRELLDAMDQDWTRDEAAASALIDIENDRIMRMALEYRGGVPLPTEQQ